MNLLGTLPSLQGKRGSIVHVIYQVLAIVVLAMIIGSAVFAGLGYFRDAPAAARYGFWLGSDDNGMPIVYKAASSAKAAGVIDDSHIVAIDDVALPPRTTRFTVGAELSGLQGPLVLTLADDAGRRTRHVLPRTDGSEASILLYHGLSAFAFGIVRMIDRMLDAIVLIGMSLLLFRRRPLDSEAMLLAFGFLLIAYEWSDTDWLLQLGIHYNPAVQNWLGSSLDVLGWWCLLVGLCAFPGGDFTTPWSRYARLMPTIYVIANMITNFRLWDFGLPNEAVDIPIFIAVAGSLLVRYRKTPAGIQRQQIKWAAFGAAIMILASFLTFALQEPALIARLGPTPTYLLRLLGNDMKLLAFPLGLLVSLLRYRLYDADAVIVRSAGYAILTAALVAIFACVEQLVQALGQDYFGSSLGAFAGGLGAAVATVMIAPLHRRANDWAERRFRMSLTILRDGLPLLVGDMREIATAGLIAETVLTRCEAALHGKRSALLINDRPVAVRNVVPSDVEAWFAGWIESDAERQTIDRHDSLFPLRVPLDADGIGAVGWLLFGPRPDGSLYGKDERETLAMIADSVARALAVAIERERRETDLREELSSQRRLIDLLIERLGLAEDPPKAQISIDQGAEPAGSDTDDFPTPRSARNSKH